MAPPQGSIALNTGGNRGIGFETARQLGQRGIAVLIGARDAERGRRPHGRLRCAGGGRTEHHGVVAMSGAWITLIVAGLVEIAWSQSIKPTESFTRPGPSLVCVALGVTSVYLLSRAMRDLPVGTAYAVFTGIGSVGAVTLGVVLHNDPVTVGRLLAVALILAGILAARLFGAS